MQKENKKENSPLVSVIMPVYNSERYIKKTVSSILQQTYSNFELIIINDLSEDSTRQIINSIEDSRIKIFDNILKLGTTESYNLGFRKAKGEFIVICDHDDISFRKRIELQLNYLLNNPAVDVLGSQINVIDESDKYLYNIASSINHNDIVLSLEKFGEGVNNPALMVRKSIFEKCGYYDEKYYPAADYEYYLRNSSALVLHNLELSLLEWRSLPSSVSHKNVKMFYKQIFLISKKHLYEKYYFMNRKKYYEYMTFRSYYTDHLLKATCYSLITLFNRTFSRDILRILINSTFFYFFIKIIRKFNVIENPKFLKIKKKYFNKFSFYEKQ